MGRPLLKLKPRPEFDEPPLEYHDGQLACLKGVKKRDCPYGALQLQKRSWWLAGWNDIDIELSQ
jgi:ribosome modulation factor